ncbi:MAG: adenylate/guanylate cyclase domain-containing protein [Gemmatimonadota bacterium]
MKLRRYTIALLIAAGAGLLAYTLTTLRLFEGSVGQLEYATIDYRMRSAQSWDVVPDSADVRLVLFDSAFVASWPYLSPFPRAALASLIDAAAAGGAQAIGLDVYLDARYPSLDALDSGDVKLRDAIRRAGNVVLVAPTFGPSTSRTIQPPHPYFSEVAAAVASADLPTPFETVRDGVLTVRIEEGLVPSFALALYAHWRGLNLDSLLAAAAKNGWLDVPGLPDAYARLPEEATQTWPIAFMGPPSRPFSDAGAFIAFSGESVAGLNAVRAFQPAALATLGFKDRVVILGSGFHESERFRTPFYNVPDSTGMIAGWTYGPEVHANALQNLIGGRFLQPLSWHAKLLFTIAIAVAVAVVTFARGVKWGAGAALGLSFVSAVIASIVFGRNALVVPVVSPALASLFAFLGSTSYVSIVEGKEKRMIKGAFGKFVSPRVADELMADPSRLKLGGDRRQISMLFSDLAGFTSMSEMLDPQKLVLVLNEYLHEMAELVKQEDGYVDKYIGDAVMALYGAPNGMPDHATRACRTALRMQRRLDELNGKWRAQDPTWKQLKVRIGLNTGDPVVGNIGGAEKIQYTALGDAVNLAARLEPACKSYGVGIMLAQQTREDAGDGIQVRELDMLAVYGKQEPVRVYELLGMRGEPVAVGAEVLEPYNRGLAAYRNRDFELALQYFKAALEHRHDGPSALYIERCEEYMVNPPPADWDFVERRQVK